MNARSVRPRAEQVEGIVQVVILLTIATMAAAASFTHVHNVAAAHGQPGWLAWADAVVLELMSIATGLEIRRRHRGAQPAGFVLWVLIGAVILSLSAQVVEAEQSFVGWLAAALPAGGFLALVKIVMTRTPAGPPPQPVPDPVPGAVDQVPIVLAVPETVPTVPTGVPAAVPIVPTVPDPVPDPVPAVPDSASVVPAVPATVLPVPAAVPAERSQPDTADADRGLSTELFERARIIASAYRAEHGRAITRDQLRAALGIGTDPATVLHRQIRLENPPARSGLVPVAHGAFTRVNGAAQ